MTITVTAIDIPNQIIYNTVLFYIESSKYQCFFCSYLFPCGAKEIFEVRPQTVTNQTILPPTKSI